MNLLDKALNGYTPCLVPRSLHKMTKLEQIAVYASARLAEQSTWQGIAFIAALFGSRYANLPWGQCAALGASLSAVMKIVFPDSVKPAETKP
jgi:hypothetical protein